MNRKQLLVIVVIGLVLGGIGLYLNQQKSASFERTDKTESERLLGDFAINDVRRITVRQHTNSVNLVKGDVWTVQERHGYPANADEIVEFARKLWDLRAAQSQKIGESQLDRLELIAPEKGGTNSATLVELKDKDGKPVRSLLLGKKSMHGGGGDSPGGGGGWPNGRWLYRQDKPGTAYLVSETFNEVEPKPEHWLKKDFFKIEKLKAISVVSTNATNSWKLTRDVEGGDLKLADKKEGEEFDTTKASSVGYALSSPSFNDVLAPDAKPESTGMDHPLIATLETFDNFTYTVKIGSKTNEDNYPLQVSVKADITKERTPGKDEKKEDKEKLDKEFQEKVKKFDEKLKQEQTYDKWTYLVSKWTIDPLLKERKDFFAEKKKEEKKDEKPGETTTDTKTDKPVPPVPVTKKEDK